MSPLCKVLASFAVASVVGLIAHWANAASLEGRSYSYETIYTPDNPCMDSGCGAFEPDGVLLLDINGDGFEGTWRQRRFRRRSFFRADFDAYGFHYRVNGFMPTSGTMHGTALYLDEGDLKLVRWRATESGCTPVPAT